MTLFPTPWLCYADILSITKYNLTGCFLYDVSGGGGEGHHDWFGEGKSLAHSLTAMSNFCRKLSAVAIVFASGAPLFAACQKKIISTPSPSPLRPSPPSSAASASASSTSTPTRGQTGRAKLTTISRCTVTPPPHPPARARQPSHKAKQEGDTACKIYLGNIAKAKRAPTFWWCL